VVVAMHWLVQFLKNNLLLDSAATLFRNLRVVGSFMIILWQIFLQSIPVCLFSEKMCRYVFLAAKEVLICPTGPHHPT